MPLSGGDGGIVVVNWERSVKCISTKRRKELLLASFVVAVALREKRRNVVVVGDAGKANLSEAVYI